MTQASAPVAPGTRFLERARAVPLRPLELPATFRTGTLADIKNRELRDHLGAYAAQFYTLADHGIAPFLIGRVGTYKTYGACVLLGAVHTTLAITCEFFDCATEMPRMDRGWYEGYATRRIEEVAAAPFLVVDDFTQIRDSGRELSIFAEIVNRRYASGFPTLYTANLAYTDTTFTELEQRYSAPVVRRIRERTQGWGLMLG